MIYEYEKRYSNSKIVHELKKSFSNLTKSSQFLKNVREPIVDALFLLSCATKLLQPTTRIRSIT